MTDSAFDFFYFEMWFAELNLLRNEFAWLKANLGYIFIH